MGLISPGGQNLLDFLELRQVLSTYDGALRTHRILYKHLDHAAPESVWAILRGLFSAEFQAKVKAVMPEINENFTPGDGSIDEESSQNQ